MPETLARPEYRLADNLAASDSVVFLTGTQALIRLPLMRRPATRRPAFSRKASSAAIAARRSAWSTSRPGRRRSCSMRPA